MRDHPLMHSNKHDRRVKIVVIERPTMQARGSSLLLPLSAGTATNLYEPLSLENIITENEIIATKALEKINY